MATEIPDNFELADNKILVKANKQDGQSICTGLVHRVSHVVHGSATVLSRLIREIPDPNLPGDLEAPPNPPIGTLHGSIVFNLEAAQEVSINSEEFYVVDVSGVLGLLPVPFVELT